MGQGEINVEGYIVKTDRLYTRTDEWVKPEGDHAIVGITDYAQKQLQDITYVELPQPGVHVEKGEPVGTIESVKAAAEIYAPVPGEITESNTRLEDEPELVNQDPYGDGWIYRLKPSIPLGDAGLLSPEKYAELIRERIR